MHVRVYVYKTSIIGQSQLWGVLSLVSKCTWCFDPPVVIWIDAHFFLVPREGELAAVQRLQLVVALQIRPSPDAAVDDMWQAFPV